MESKSKYLKLYKSLNGTEDLQEDRRVMLLKQQKEQRSVLQDEYRNFDQNKDFNSTQTHHIRARNYFQKYGHGENRSLQLSEWLRQRPHDLNRWFLVPCPKGQRCLLVASNGITEMYSKVGRRIFSFHSMLNGDRSSNNSDFTTLDCIFNKDLKTFYVLDALVLGNHDLINCETEFRQFWIKSKFAENPDLDLTSNKNEYSIKLLNYYDFEMEDTISECLNRYPQWPENQPQLDGFLFYHKDSSYICGTTPLVGWLFPFMINEVLNFAVNKGYTAEKPEDYCNYEHFIEVFDEDLSKKRMNKRRSNRQSITEEEIITDDDFVLINARELELN